MIEVCLDCHLQHHTGETVTGTEWNLLAPNETVTDNTVCSVCFELEIECGHNNDPFSSIPCHGCGSTLAGARFTYAVWSK